MGYRTVTGWRLWALRAFLIPSALLIIPYSVIAEFCRELRGACWYAWNQGCQEAGTFKRYWRGEIPTDEECGA